LQPHHHSHNVLFLSINHILFSLELPCYIFIDWELFLGSTNFGVDVDQFSNTFLLCMYHHSQDFFLSILWYQKLVEVTLDFFLRSQFFGKKMTKFCQKIITGSHSRKKKTSYPEIDCFTALIWMIVCVHTSTKYDLVMAIARTIYGIKTIKWMFMKLRVNFCCLWNWFPHVRRTNACVFLCRLLQSFSSSPKIG